MDRISRCSWQEESIPLGDLRVVYLHIADNVALLADNSKGGWLTSRDRGKELKRPKAARSRAAAPLPQKESLESDIWSGCLLRAFFWRDSGHVQLRGDPRVDPEPIGEVLFLSWDAWRYVSSSTSSCSYYFFFLLLSFINYLDFLSSFIFHNFLDTFSFPFFLKLVDFCPFILKIGKLSQQSTGSNLCRLHTHTHAQLLALKTHIGEDPHWHNATNTLIYKPNSNLKTS